MANRSSNKKSRRNARNFSDNVVSLPQTRKKVSITCQNDHQKEYLTAIKESDITFGIGPAGTGKTFVSALMALQMYTNQETDINKIVICRPAALPKGENLGALPGDLNAKMDPYIQPIFDAFRTYWEERTIVDHIQNRDIEIVPLSYMRGRSFSNCYIMLDEAQNATIEHMFMFLTRLGEGSKMVITGDPRQNDLRSDSNSGLVRAMQYLDDVDEISFVTFDKGDCVRHPTVAKILDNWPEKDQYE